MVLAVFLEAVHDEPADLVKELVAGLLPVSHLNVQLQVLHAVREINKMYKKCSTTGKPTRLFRTKRTSLDSV